MSIPTIENPLTCKIPLIQRIAKFSCVTIKDTIRVAYVNSAFADTMKNFHTAFLIILAADQDERQQHERHSGKFELCFDTFIGHGISWFDKEILDVPFHMVLKSHADETHQAEIIETLKERFIRSIAPASGMYGSLLMKCITNSYHFQDPVFFRLVLRAYDTFGILEKELTEKYHVNLLEELIEHHPRGDKATRTLSFAAELIEFYHEKTQSELRSTVKELLMLKNNNTAADGTSNNCSSPLLMKVLFCNYAGLFQFFVDEVFLNEKYFAKGEDLLSLLKGALTHRDSKGLCILELVAAGRVRKIDPLLVRYVIDAYKKSGPAEILRLASNSDAEHEPEVVKLLFDAHEEAGVMKDCLDALLQNENSTLLEVLENCMCHCLRPKNVHLLFEVLRKHGYLCLALGSLTEEDKKTGVSTVLRLAATEISLNDSVLEHQLLAVCIAQFDSQWEFEARCPKRKSDHEDRREATEKSRHEEAFKFLSDRDAWKKSREEVAKL